MTHYLLVYIKSSQQIIQTHRTLLISIYQKDAQQIIQTHRPITY